MAKEVMLRHPTTGVVKKGLYGFSWTTLLFGPFVPLCRRDYGTFFVLLLLCLLFGIFASIGFAFVYNKQYTRKLLEQGYVFDDRPETVQEARLKLGVTEQPYAVAAAA